MFLWINIFTCPSILFCPRNPHPKGNEYRTIFCGESGIMYVCEVVKRKENMISMERPDFKTGPKMKIIELMLRLTREIWSTG